MTSARFLTLGRWYATPLTLICRLNLLIARYWLDEPVDHAYQTLAAQARARHSPRARALLEVIFGQLLAARRHPEAAHHLERGFSDGRNLLAPADYFVVLKRHALLRLLPPDGAGEALALEDLLTTARVIERMSGGRATPPPVKHPPGAF
jgi:hypothetical protein